MLLKKMIAFAKKCQGTPEQIKKMVEDFVDGEEILDENDEVVDLDSIKFNKVEIKERVIDIEVKKAVKEAVKEEKEVEEKEVNKIETKAIECDTFEVPEYNGRLQAFKTNKEAFTAAQHFMAYALNNVAAKQWCADYGVKSANVASDAAGGYLASQEMARTVEVMLREYGIARKLITVTQMDELVSYFNKATGGLTAYIVAESAATTESAIVFDQDSMTAKEMSVLSEVTNLLNVNSVISMVDLLVVEASRAISKKEDEIILTGDGSAGMAAVTGVKPALEAAPDTTCVIAQGTGYDWGDIEYTDFIAAIALVPTEYRRSGAGWICSRTFKALAIDKILYGLSGNSIPLVEKGTGGSFMDYPIHLSETMPATFEDDKVACIFGNLDRACKIGDRTNGITISESDSHNNSFKNRTKYYRFDRMSAYSVYGVRQDGPVSGIIVDSSS